jgi:hypothetical protein
MPLAARSAAAAHPRVVASVEPLHAPRADDARAARSTQDVELILPPSYGRYDAQGVFEEAEWAAALADDPRRDLKFDLHFNGPNASGTGPAARLQRQLEQQWAAMSAAERAPHEAAARARCARKAAYEASCVPAAAASTSLLRALLARCREVHTLDVSREQYGRRDAPVARLDGALLRQVGAAWGASLRLARLGDAVLSVDDIHAFLEACPHLIQLHLRRVTLAAGSLAALFGDGMAPHAALRSVALPPVSKSLAALVERLPQRCAALREIDAEAFDATRGDGASVVARVARAAAARGVRRFLCSSFFANGGSDGEYGSDGGSMGEYCGDGDVLKYVRGGRDLDDDDDDEGW